ncbi:hypothetical protein [Paraburkholderia fungorum]|uniref:hypothetical protein n=1 Tax=Paraburkholderia fungorum TaxID=134537 RepID=UPI00160D5F8B|nr:hypothetical protein [Paraburkholderia fungorum]MBB5547539.1 prophage DNA circulation protein [Paraburkholderia fungorum]
MDSLTAFAAAAQALAASVFAYAANPADAVRMLINLANFTPNAPTPTYSVGSAMADIQDATGDLFRRAAVVALARASSTYQPASADDAANVRMLVVGALDNEILIAGDQGEDGTFNALRALRAAVIQDLATRGAGLPSTMTVSLKAALPAPVLAQQLYRDPGRSDEIVSEANCPHPAFLPSSFKVLSS